MCRGVGLVNLMGRSSGFIAMQASMASGVVDICLIPEITFTMAKLTAHIEYILQRKGHCVICVAEGAGQVCAHTVSSSSCKRAVIITCGQLHLRFCRSLRLCQ